MFCRYTFTVHVLQILSDMQVLFSVRINSSHCFLTQEQKLFLPSVLQNQQEASHPPCDSPGHPHGVGGVLRTGDVGRGGARQCPQEGHHPVLLSHCTR